MGKVVAAGLRLDVARKVPTKRYESLAAYAAAFRFAEIAVLDGLENLGFRAKDSALRFLDIAVDNCGKGGVFLPFESSWLFELGLPLDDPRIGGWLPVEGLGLSMDGDAPFLNHDLRGKCLRPVFASPSNNRSMVRHAPPKYDFVVPWTAK